MKSIERRSRRLRVRSSTTSLTTTGLPAATYTCSRPVRCSSVPCARGAFCNSGRILASPRSTSRTCCAYLGPPVICGRSIRTTERCQSLASSSIARGCRITSRSSPFTRPMRTWRSSILAWGRSASFISISSHSYEETLAELRMLFERGLIDDGVLRAARRFLRGRAVRSAAWRRCPTCDR